MIRGNYRNLLLEKDPRALLILGYWFAILCKLNQWWIDDRAKLECRSICMYLEHNDDHRIVGLLEFPAEACEYALVTKGQHADLLGEGGDLAFGPAPQGRISSVEYGTP
jgi:hypothetical protein